MIADRRTTFAVIELSRPNMMSLLSCEVLSRRLQQLEISPVYDLVPGSRVLYSAVDLWNKTGSFAVLSHATTLRGRRNKPRREKVTTREQDLNGE
jgi:hypothetical protein